MMSLELSQQEFKAESFQQKSLHDKLEVAV